MNTDTETSPEAKGGRSTVAALLVIVEALRADLTQLSDRVEGLREGAAGRLDVLDARLTEVANRAEVIASGLDEVVARMAPPAPTARPAEVAPKPEFRDGGSVRFIGRELTIPRPGAANGAKLTIRHRDVFSGETAAYLREHHPDLVESYPRAKAE